MESGEERRQRVTKHMSVHPKDNTSIEIRALTTLDQFERCVVLQLEVWGYSDGDVIPRRVFIVAQRIGGQVIGAFDGDTIIGFAMALPGYRDGYPYLHSHMLAVLPLQAVRRTMPRPAQMRARTRCATHRTTC